MKVSDLRNLLDGLDDEDEVYVRNTVNPTGNIADLEQVELSTYGFFGKSIPCVILNTYYNTPESEIDKDGDVAIQPFKDSRREDKEE